MQNSEEARLLLDLAKGDLKSVSAMRDPADFVDRIFGFQAQQAVEKALKAWLSALGVEYPFTHSLDVLTSLLEDHVGRTVQQFEDLEMLTPFAVQFRYEAYQPPAEKLDREQVIRRVSELVDHVARLVEGDPEQR